MPQGRAFVFHLRISMCSRGTGAEAIQMEPAEALLRLKMTAQVLQCFKNAYLQARLGWRNLFHWEHVHGFLL